MAITTRNTARQDNQREQLLDALKTNYPACLSLDHLRAVAGERPGARVAELRKDGWKIETVCVDNESRLSTYRLISKTQAKAVEIDAAVTLHAVGGSWTSRVHQDLTGKYSEEELAQAAQEALSAFKKSLGDGFDFGALMANIGCAK